MGHMLRRQVKIEGALQLLWITQAFIFVSVFVLVFSNITMLKVLQYQAGENRVCPLVGVDKT